MDSTSSNIVEMNVTLFNALHMFDGNQTLFNSIQCYSESPN